MYSVFCLMLIRVTQVLMVTYDYLKARKFKPVVSDSIAVIVFVLLTDKLMVLDLSFTVCQVTT